MEGLYILLLLFVLHNWQTYLAPPNPATMFEGGYNTPTVHHQNDTSTPRTSQSWASTGAAPNPEEGPVFYYSGYTVSYPPTSIIPNNASRSSAPTETAPNPGAATILIPESSAISPDDPGTAPISLEQLLRTPTHSEEAQADLDDFLSGVDQTNRPSLSLSPAGPSTAPNPEVGSLYYELQPSTSTHNTSQSWAPSEPVPSPTSSISSSSSSVSSTMEQSLLKQLNNNNMDIGTQVQPEMVGVGVEANLPFASRSTVGPSTDPSTALPPLLPGTRGYGPGVTGVLLSPGRNVYIAFPPGMPDSEVRQRLVEYVQALPGETVAWETQTQLTGLQPSRLGSQLGSRAEHAHMETPSCSTLAAPQSPSVHVSNPGRLPRRLDRCHLHLYEPTDFHRCWFRFVDHFLARRRRKKCKKQFSWLTPEEIQTLLDLITQYYPLEVIDDRLRKWLDGHWLTQWRYYSKDVGHQDRPSGNRRRSTQQTRRPRRPHGSPHRPGRQARPKESDN